MDKLSRYLLFNDCLVGVPPKVSNAIHPLNPGGKYVAIIP